MKENVFVTRLVDLIIPENVINFPKEPNTSSKSPNSIVTLNNNSIVKDKGKGTFPTLGRTIVFSPDRTETQFSSVVTSPTRPAFSNQLGPIT